ncbi:hypothetical protein GIS00_25675 [Nakamurella sp. YIM 132087]|uniref:HicB family toxin-antitoxin system n=1 Tax=Nakamurella alba TaxID=2665158 RepID=A0A7K1FT42_9ACTN|nr:hypothetical protein [Nakamurella alba]MTD17326.1 hypothetical protein [Nakamurella alba]
MTVYTAQVSRGEKYWLVHVPEIDRTTQARTLLEVEAMVRDLIVVMEQVEPSSIELRVRIELPDEARQHLAEADRLRGIALDAQSRAAEEYRTAALALRAAGLGLREIGAALGISHQRAHQLVTAA